MSSAAGKSTFTAMICLNQVCEPIEIVFSDDCSSDGTLSKLHSMAAQYRGPHRVDRILDAWGSCQGYVSLITSYATFAFHKKLFTVFSPLVKGVDHEDPMGSLRAAKLAGGLSSRSVTDDDTESRQQQIQATVVGSHTNLKRLEHNQASPFKAGGNCCIHQKKRNRLAPDRACNTIRHV